MGCSDTMKRQQQTNQQNETNMKCNFLGMNALKIEKLLVVEKIKKNRYRIKIKSNDELKKY